VQELARHNLVRLRERLHARPLRDPVLAALWAALPPEPEVLRVSPHRTVLRLPSAASPDGRSWLLKLDHPRRPAEALRRLLRLPPGLRERRAWGLLGGTEARAEELAADLVVFARPWIERAAPGDWAAGLDALHDRGWSDPDLALEDLAWTADGRLLPLDLGHAAHTPGGAPQLARAADRAVLAAALPRVEGLALLAAAGGATAEAATQLERALGDRARRAWIRAARCGRDCRDFERVAGGSLRRGFAPGDSAGEPLAAGRRSEVRRHGEAVAKRYRRPGAAGALRRALPALSPAFRALRRFHLLELEGIPAALPLGRQGDTLWTAAVGGRPAGPADLPALADWLRRLHERGHGLRDAKPANFHLTAEGPVLLDADGLTPARQRPARDLGRLVAETAPGSEAEAAVLAAHPAPGRDEVRRWAERFRAVLARRR
jgi:hypothetical protein